MKIALYESLKTKGQKSTLDECMKSNRLHESPKRVSKLLKSKPLISETAKDRKNEAPNRGQKARRAVMEDAMNPSASDSRAKAPGFMPNPFPEPDASRKVETQYSCNSLDAG